MEKLLDNKIVELLNYRIQQEEYSSRLYGQMSLWFENQGFKNLAALYKKYEGEEKTHAQWSCDFLLNFGITPELKALESPYVEYEDYMELLQDTLTHELTITKQCEELAQKALEMSNTGLFALASKYCAEQVEEVGKAIDILDHAKLTTDKLILDHYIERYL